MAKKDIKKANWSGRFNEPVTELVKRFTASIGFDQKLGLYDIEGSVAHAEMLAAQKIITQKDLKAIQSGLQSIQKEILAGTFKWSLDLEDVHLNIEKRLTDKIGEAGKKLHTGRSRNDQVATDLRLWLRETIDQTIQKIKTLQLSVVQLADKHQKTIMPGFTHLQVAQPVTFGHHLMAYYEMLQRDLTRFEDARKRMNQLPLGAAALAGTSYPIDRNRVAKKLKFDGVCENSLDAVSDRDFAIEFTFAASLLMTHLSRFSEELIMWSSPMFGFVEIADGFCTGSSIMPQKKNPDVPELVRGKTGRVTGHLMSLLMLMKAQPLAYNKDNQEDKEPLFDTANTILDVLTIYADMLKSISVNEKNMKEAALKGYATATDLADYLVIKGVAFRDAHEIVAKAVNTAIKKKCDLSELKIDELKKFSKMISSDVYSHLTLEGSIKSRNHTGGTSFEQVKKSIEKAKKRLKQ
ncbi:MAG: argininosuccinate lyase [Candidatus Methylopumilus sp.]|jgi:argininosuccinate lyase|uniref:argininosuccinate lyase n=1 Tax=Candidatus Methylopumilus universalis TaxID=2588536 RepID=UPI00111DBF88|nr:argininosuccinate lyase [Candidatus Methylopumilus universalis]MBW0156476.1 argininosuccinate lyase [Candidatus Methylopumilus sp.]QDC70003.1 argininosuccinate lyase [Candidatus Methylopumilus universalis]